MIGVAASDKAEAAAKIPESRTSILPHRHLQSQGYSVEPVLVHPEATTGSNSRTDCGRRDIDHRVFTIP
jgi:hypothetical protein